MNTGSKLGVNGKKQLLFLCAAFLFTTTIWAGNKLELQQKTITYKGQVLSAKGQEVLIFANIRLKNSNISTITNGEGRFSLKIPVHLQEGVLLVTHIGYQETELPLSDFEMGEVVIRLDPAVIRLSEINVFAPKDVRALVWDVFKKKAENYSSKRLLMTAFYRETIKKRKQNASLTEAVVKVYKSPYSSLSRDVVTLYKSRKNTNYNRLDTLALKLQGGPFSALYADIVKYPEFIFTEKGMDNYSFSFNRSTQINNQRIYIVDFKPLQKADALYYKGKLFIEVESKALVSAIYSLDITDEKRAGRLFIKKKPSGVKVHPTHAIYRIDYRKNSGFWHYGYSSIQLGFKVKWDKKIFNTKYNLHCEMAVTDWDFYEGARPGRAENRLRPSTIIVDQTAGFADPNFWGAHNLIEPEKSIQAAIKKISKQLN